MRNLALEELINNELKVSEFQDYAPNGLQVEGRSHVQKIVTGVTACQALLDKAVEMNADAVIVHHGYFWKNEPVVIKGMKRKRLKTLLENDINLYGYHLPLDAHPHLGNNTQLAHIMGVKIDGHIEPLMPFGYFDQPITPAELTERLETHLGRKALHCGDTGNKKFAKLHGAQGVDKALFCKPRNLV